MSIKLLKILNGMVGEVKDIAKMSTRDVWPAFAVTNVRVSLPSALGRSEELECEIWTSPRDYQEAMRTKFGLTTIPAAKIGENIYTGEHAVTIASDLHTLLTANKYTSAEQILYHLAATAKSLAETQIREAREEIELKEAPLTNVFRQTISEKLSNLEKLYKEKKIDDETYRKMKKTYEELLGKSIE
ncbi:MAG: hypothetical protein QW810_08160 [Nitrososphaerota archaeon]